jgi:hypothetical protein
MIEPPPRRIEYAADIPNESGRLDQLRLARPEQRMILAWHLRPSASFSTT